MLVFQIKIIKKMIIKISNHKVKYNYLMKKFKIKKEKL